MKKFVYILGTISLSILLVATIFKSLHLQGAAILLTIGLGLLSFIFLPMVYVKLLKSTGDKLLKLVYHAGFVSFFISFIGIHFKILHLPGANILLILGIPLPFILFLPSYILYHNNRKLKTDLNFFGVVIFMIYLGVFTSLLAFDTSYKTLNAYAHASYEVLETNEFLAKTNSNSKYQKQCTELVEQLEMMKRKIIFFAKNEDSKALNPNTPIDYYSLNVKHLVFSYGIIEERVLSDFNINFETFKSDITQLSSNSTINRLIEEIDMYRIPVEENTKPILTKLKLIAMLNVLTDWQNKILFINYIIGSESQLES